MKENPGYFSILISEVRYSKKINFRQKVLYAEISALTNKHGYCFASNAYLSDLFDTTPETISRDISKLTSEGFIRVEISKEKGNERRIYLLLKQSRGHDQTVNTPIDETINTPIDETIKYNNTSINNTSINNTENRTDSKKIMEITNEILIHLNQFSGENFEPKWANKQYIHERLNEGADPEMMKMVIELKSQQAQKIVKGKPVFDPVYLRPQTLFSKNNYDKYIREVNRALNGESIIPFKKRKSAGIERALNGIDEALQRRFESTAGS